MRGFGLAYGTTAVLDALDLTIGSRGAIALMGPGGSGKSTLLRTLAGLSGEKPDVTTWGTSWSSAALDSHKAVLVAQNARLVVSSVFENLASGFADRSRMLQMEQRAHAVALLHAAGLEDLTDALDAPMLSLPLGKQRAVGLVRCVASNPALLLLDEPTTSLDGPCRTWLIDLIRSEATRRAVVVATHNICDARELDGDVVLLAGGRIVERTRAETFVRSPRSDEGRALVATGSCISPSLGLRAPATSGEGFRIPSGFRFVNRPSLAGTARPGLLASVEDDLRGLAGLGIRTLVTLEEERTVSPEELAHFGIESLHVPIRDMAAPSVDVALSLCLTIGQRIANGRWVALHCRAGLGRTGTMLAACLILGGESSVNALERVRRVHCRYVQSDAQVEFLDAFAKHVERVGGLERGASFACERLRIS